MTIVLRRAAVLVAAHFMYMAALAAPSPALAMQILDAADHAELMAEISASGVNRIALHGDRIAKAVRAPDGYAVEHDAVSGDLYLRPSTPSASGELAGEPVTLFIGTERGFTYRLTLIPADRDSAQILIRNGGAEAGAEPPAVASVGGTHVAALVRLVRAVARREVLPGYAIEAGPAPGNGVGGGLPPIRVGSPVGAGLKLIETWRGPRFAALVFEAALPASDAADGPAGLAGTIEAVSGIGPTGDVARLAAVWLAAPGTAPSGGRLAVAVVDGAAARGLR